MQMPCKEATSWILTSWHGSKAKDLDNQSDYFLITTQRKQETHGWTGLPDITKFWWKLFTNQLLNIMGSKDLGSDIHQMQNTLLTTASRMQFPVEVQYFLHILYEQTCQSFYDLFGYKVLKMCLLVCLIIHIFKTLIKSEIYLIYSHPSMDA